MIYESRINPADVKEIFKDATTLRNKPTGLGKIFKNLRKKEVGVDDLQNAWKEYGNRPEEHYPLDTRDIRRILSNFGFDDKEINKVFGQVFGTSGDDEEYNEPTGTQNINRLIDYAKKNNLIDSMKQFLQDEFGEELGISKDKAMYEEVNKIFTAIVQEERWARPLLLKQMEQSQLGRSRKQIDEVVSLNDVLKADSFVTLMSAINTKIGTDINVTRIKNQVLQSWKKGMKSRKHYDKLLSQIDISLNDLIK